MRKVKGYCPDCLAWRAFELRETYYDVFPVYSTALSTPAAYIGGMAHSKGVCSRGHETEFTRRETLHMPRYKREVNPKDYAGRGSADAFFYKVNYLKKFRRIEKEEHHKTGHVCDWRQCPHYEHPECYWDEWGLN